MCLGCLLLLVLHTLLLVLVILLLVLVDLLYELMLMCKAAQPL
jgi:hypothetical protein